MPDFTHDYELVMPFLPVESRGGPFADEGYVAGWEMGALDMRLSMQPDTELEVVYLTENTGQADLIAMRHGYTIEMQHNQDGWVSAILRKS